MQAVLVMFRSDGERRSFSIARDVTVIGRREDCDLRIPLGDVSRKHCRIVRDGELLKLEDLGSSNGTFHNGQRVQEVLLGAGDTVQIGPVVFVLQIDGVPADEDLQPVTGESSEAADSVGGMAAASASAAAASAAVASVSAAPNDLGDLQPTAASEAGELEPLELEEAPTQAEAVDDGLEIIEPGAESAAGVVAELEEVPELEPLAEEPSASSNAETVDEMEPLEEPAPAAPAEVAEPVEELEPLDEEPAHAEPPAVLPPAPQPAAEQVHELEPVSDEVAELELDEVAPIGEDAPEQIAQLPDEPGLEEDESFELLTDEPSASATGEVIDLDLDAEEKRK